MPDAAPPTDQAVAADEAFVVDVDGFEGPLDLLLALARSHKVDLARISILALVDQYLAFVEAAGRRRLELAADYLVMAAWLAYLKSRLLIPNPPKSDEPSGEDMAAVLAFRLQRLQAMRERASALMGRNRLGRDVFGRGAPEPLIVAGPVWQAGLYDLLAAYAGLRQKIALSHVRVARRTVLSLAEARAILERLIGAASDWTALDGFLADYLGDGDNRASVLASSFASTLELVRDGSVEVQQSAPMAPIYLRSRRPRASNGSPTG